MDQREFLLGISKMGIAAEFPENPREFMNSLMTLIRAEKAVVGICEEGKVHITYQNGFEREPVHCGEEFLSRLRKEGFIRKEAALWFPLEENGFLGLIRTAPPPFDETELEFMRIVCGQLKETSALGDDLRALTPWPVSIVGLASQKKKCLEIAKTVGTGKGSVLFLGESGTGKEMLARFLHEHSSRKDKPFVSVNCSLLPRELAYSELFGCDPGVHSTAKTVKHGYFEMANGGTLFLDEIGDMPEDIQVALLTAMEQRVITRLGGTKIPVDILILAATDRDLERGIREGTFRGALFARFEHRISIPPLKERREEIPLLANFFLDSCSKDTRAISREAMQCLRDHDWPWNVRGLRNVIREAATFSKKEIVFSWDLPPEVRHARKVQDYQEKIRGSLKESEKEQIMKVLEEARGNRVLAAKILGISRSGLYNKLVKFGISKI